nr:hypothetical protein [Tanacetum cinerariifolium]
MLMCKQQEARIQISAEKYNWVQDSDDEEEEDHELEAHYVYMAKIQECDSNTTPDSSDMSNNGEEADQDEQKFQEERVLLASLIKQMKCEIDENKKINKSLESSNKELKKANTSSNSEIT